MVDKWVSYARKRVREGKSLHEVMNEISAKGVPERDIDVILEKVMKGEKGASFIGKNLQAIVIALIAVCAIALMIGYFVFFTGHDEEIMPEPIEEPEEIVVAEEPVQENKSEWLNRGDDPLQTEYAGEPIIKEAEGNTYKLTPVAEYNIAAMLGYREYYDDFRKVSPMDMVLFWGGLANSKYMKELSFSHIKRAADVRIDRDSFYNITYLQQHSSNHHIIPANENVLLGLKRLNTSQIAYMKGYLVDVEGDTLSFWETSMSRTDAEDEIFYVEKLSYGNNTYG